MCFALNEGRPPAFFAGISTLRRCTRTVAEGEVTCDLFAFLTTDPKRKVADVHPKAMPVILTSAEQADAWLSTPWPDARRRQRSMPDGAVRVVARGGKEDALARPLLPV